MVWGLMSPSNDLGSEAKNVVIIIMLCEVLLGADRGVLMYAWMLEVFILPEPSRSQQPSGVTKSHLSVHTKTRQLLEVCSK